MKRRFLSLLLCVCMIASLAVLFSSCAKNKVDLTETYTVVYGDGMSFIMSGEVQSFAALLKEKTNTDVTTKKVIKGNEVEDESKFEILLGETNRPETQKVLEKMEGHGYAIEVVGKKIVIVGTTNLLTWMAMDHFKEIYLSGEGTLSELTVEKAFVATEMVELTKDWSFVYSSYLRGEADYIIDAIAHTQSEIESQSGIRGNAMPVISDADSATNEILTGTVDREETKTLLASMDATDYAFAVKNGKLLICAFSDTMMKNAFTLFEHLLNDSIYQPDGSAKQVLFPADFTRIYTDTGSNYITDFPRPKNLTLVGTMDVYDSSYQYCYQGEGVNAEAFEAYCGDLVAAGYQLYTEHSAAGSTFRTYTNKTSNIMLYVAYNAFASEATEETGHKPTIRVIVGQLDKCGILDEDMLAMQPFTKLQASSITAVKESYDLSVKGQMYIVTLEDGSFIIVDGNSSSTVASDRIYEILLDLYKKGHNGKTPIRTNPIRIAAWYVTHNHSDHYGAMTRFINKYCKDYNKYFVTIDTMIANFHSDEGNYGVYVDKEISLVIRDTVAEISSKISDAPGEEAGMKLFKVHTGQRFWLANVECEVLYTHEDLYPGRLLVFNDSSTVIRMTLHHTDGTTRTEGSATSVIWLGDVQTAGCQYMRSMYGSYLKSDMVQVSHHYATGSEFRVYQLAKPTWLLFPCSGKNFTGQYKKDTSVTYMICEDISTVKYVVLSDFCNYTVPITATGADPEGVYNAADVAPVALTPVNVTVLSGFMRTKYANS